jgi:hypothetical protein
MNWQAFEGRPCSNSPRPCDPLGASGRSRRRSGGARSRASGCGAAGLDGAIRDRDDALALAEEVARRSRRAKA